MNRRTVGLGTLVESGLTRGQIPYRTTGRWRIGALGIVAALTLSIPVAGSAQERSVTRFLPPGADLDFRLTLRPRELATATSTAAAGEFTLDSFPGSSSSYRIVVPQACVGARRCPLLVGSPTDDGTFSKRVAKYGIILMYGEIANKHQLTAGLRQVLRQFAIDPDKIAILGHCGGAPFATEIAFQNPDVFSRVVAASGSVSLPPGLGREARRVEMLAEEGIDDTFSHYRYLFQLRQLGNNAELAIGFRGHENQVEEYDFIGHWLQQSWAIPNPTARPAPEVFEPLPVLTFQNVLRMTLFWTSFMQEPDSIKVEARRAHLRAVALPIGRFRAVAWMTNMGALAAKYPSVAAKLKRAGLTPYQHDAYRVALFSALAITGEAASLEGLVNLEQEMEFLKATAAVPDAQKTSEDSTIVQGYASRADWQRQLKTMLPPEVAAGNTLLVQARNASWVEARSDMLDSLAATGVWRTP